MKFLYRNRAVSAFLAILAATLLLHGQVLNAWWCCDDTQILKHAFEFSPRAYFSVPEAWRALVPTSLTPWLTLSYDFDLALFTFAPVGFYAHNLLTITLCAWLLYCVAREWVNDLPALGGSLLFLLGSPITVASHQLMVRHYVEGLFFYLLALLLIIRGMRSEKLRRLGLLAGAAYAIAASAKEIFLPLGFIPFLLPIGSFRQRFAVAWPFLLVMGLYVPWRWYMLGEAVGGYTPAGDILFLDIWTKLGQFSLVPGMLWSHPNMAMAAVSLVCVFALLRVENANWRTSGWIFAVLPLLLLPMLPLLSFPGIGPGQERYFIAVWATLSLIIAIAMGVICRVGGGRVLAFVAFAVVALPAYTVAHRLGADLTAVHAVHRAQGAAVASLDSQSIIFAAPEVSSWFNQGVLDLRPAMGILSAPPVVVADEWELFSQKRGIHRVLRYNPETRLMTDITVQLPELMALWQEHLQPTPIDVEMAYIPDIKALRWRLAAGDGVRFTFVGPGIQIPIPPQGSYRVNTPPVGCFRIRADSAQGWTAYSRPLTWPAIKNNNEAIHLSWQGNGQLFVQAHESFCPI